MSGRETRMIAADAARLRDDPALQTTSATSSGTP